MRKIRSAAAREWQRTKAGERMREEEWNAMVRNHPQWGGANYKRPTRRKVSRRIIALRKSPRVHVISEDAYDETQTNDSIRDGDVLVDKTHHVIGIMMRAWPMAITQKRGEFHTLDSASDWHSFESGQYMRSYRIAARLAKNFGWPLRRQGQQVAGDRNGRRRRRYRRDMESELRKLSLQALGRLLRQAISRGDDYKARLIEQEIDRRARRRE